MSKSGIFKLVLSKTQNDSLVEAPLSAVHYSDVKELSYRPFDGLLNLSQIRSPFIDPTSNESIQGAFELTSNLNAQINFDDLFENWIGPSDIDKIILLVLSCIAFLMAIFGNGLVVVLVFKYQRMRNRKNIFLLNLSLADLGVTLVCFPAEMARNVYPYWVFGTFLCKFSFYFQGVSMMGSVFTLVAMAVDRMMASRASISSRFTPVTLAAILALIWGLAIMVPLPIFFHRHLQVIPVELGNNYTTHLIYCRETWSYKTRQMGYSYFALVLTFLLPLGCISICYLYVGRKISRASRIDSSESTTSNNHANALGPRRSRQALHMVATLVLTFFICWLPFNINVIIVDYRMYQTFSTASHANKVLPYTLLIGYFHSAISPIIYWFVNTSFQQIARHFFEHNSSTSSSRKTSKGPPRQLGGIKGDKNHLHCRCPYHGCNQKPLVKLHKLHKERNGHIPAHEIIRNKCYQFPIDKTPETAEHRLNRKPCFKILPRQFNEQNDVIVQIPSTIENVTQL